MKIEILDSVESTNRYCEALDLTQVEDFTCYWALEQTAGIGQRGNYWVSAPGENLTFSIVLYPTFLPADKQFHLTEALSLALVDFLKAFIPLPSIKWPNDIYVGNKKICGTLVSTRLTGNNIASAVCGIGLNINQTTFPNWVPNPTSLRLLTGKEYKLEPLLTQLLDCLEKRYTELRSGRNLEPEYLNHLMNLGVPIHYIYKGEEITATITGIDPYGHLLLTTDNGQRLCCAMKEITFLPN